MKRVFDVIAAAIGILLIWPVLAMIALLVFFYLGAPVLFRQIRPGLRGKPFEIYKFRTLTDECDSSGEFLPDDRRLTCFGRFLRSTSLDELPGLFNVLKGDMSLVGPRALLPEYIPLYSPEQSRRHEVRPGITGWAQVNGRNSTNWEDRFKLDVWYVDNKSFWLDMKILCMTFVKVLKMEGINHVGHVTMEKFKGTGAVNG